MVSSVRRSVFFLGISVFSIIHALGFFGRVPAVSLLSRLLFPLVFCRRIFSVLVFVRRLSFYYIYERIVFKSFFNIVYILSEGFLKSPLYTFAPYSITNKPVCRRGAKPPIWKGMTHDFFTKSPISALPIFSYHLPSYFILYTHTIFQMTDFF